MLDYFQQKRTKSDFECLKTVAEKGHMEAMYIYNIILLCLGDDGENRESKLHGMETM